HRPERRGFRRPYGGIPDFHLSQPARNHGCAIGADCHTSDPAVVTEPGARFAARAYLPGFEGTVCAGRDQVVAVRAESQVGEPRGATEKQRPGKKLRGGEIAALQLSQQEGTALLGARLAHQPAALERLLLLLRWASLQTNSRGPQRVWMRWK